MKPTRAEVEPKPVGRPSSLQNGKRVNVYLDAESLARAKKLGNGNVSEGLRFTLKKDLIGK